MHLRTDGITDKNMKTGHKNRISIVVQLAINRKSCKCGQGFVNALSLALPLPLALARVCVFIVHFTLAYRADDHERGLLQGAEVSRQRVLL